MWEFLNVLGIYDGKRHFIFGESRKLITKDLVQEKYLEYRQMPNSDPPCYEFLDPAQTSFADESRGTPQGSQRAPSTSTPSADISYARLDEASNSQEEESSSFSYTESSYPDPLAIKADLLEQFLLYKYKMKEPIRKTDMPKIVSQKYEGHFSEILKRASERIKVAFAVDMKEVDSATENYAFVSKLHLPNNGRVCAGRGFSKTGLLMTLLGVILWKGNCTTEKEIWEFLNSLCLFGWRKHFIYAKPRKPITKTLVNLKYLEYQHVPKSDLACYEFLWCPRAHAETSKIKILEFLAKVNDIVPITLSSLYEEAMREQKGKAQTRQTYRQGWLYHHSQCIFQGHVQQLLSPSSEV
ncbi:melanoma-associated antigen B5-like [Trichechus inunguis]